MIYLCQRRQAWYQDYAKSIGEDPKTFVGTARLSNGAVPHWFWSSGEFVGVRVKDFHLTNAIKIETRRLNGAQR